LVLVLVLLGRGRLSLLLLSFRCGLTLLCLSLLLLLLLLLLVGLHCPHPELLDIFFSSQTKLRSIGSQLFTLLFSELLGCHPSFSGFSGELLLHGRHLLGVGAWHGHIEGKLFKLNEAEKKKRITLGGVVVKERKRSGQIDSADLRSALPTSRTKNFLDIRRLYNYCIFMRNYGFEC
jgi:hypothetical protein